MTIHRKDLRVRDPFIVPDVHSGCYWLYNSNHIMDRGLGISCLRSTDLENWEEPIEAFSPPPGFWGTKDFWAPEVHLYNRRYYMFATFKADDKCRGTQILVADAPTGPFVPVSDGPATPADWECLDGTLYVDEEGAPWMVFCHEWLQIGDGTMCVMPLSQDLTHPIGEPVELFHASDAPWTRPICDADKYVTDGPFLFTKDGRLYMMWSSNGAEGYAMGVAESTTGKITGPWKHHEAPLYSKDGGHGMVFSSLDGCQRILTIHTPNYPRGEERAIFLSFDEILAAAGI